MDLTLVTTLSVTVGAPILTGPVLGGMRGVVPITGGSFDGPRLRGTVLPLGADWALLQPDGAAHVDARYLLRMEDGTIVGIRNCGICRPAPCQGNTYTGQSTPVFEAPQDSPHAWMNQATFTCAFTSDLTKGEVHLRIYQIEPDPAPRG